MRISKNSLFNLHRHTPGMSAPKSMLLKHLRYKKNTLSKEFVTLCSKEFVVFCVGLCGLEGWCLNQRVGGSQTKELVRETEGLEVKYS